MIAARAFGAARGRLRLAAFLTLAAALPPVSPLSAQPDRGLPPGGITGGKTVEVPRFEERPTLDGLLNESLWARAAVVDDFHQMEPAEYSAPSQATEVRLFYTEEALYVGARMFESDPDRITARILRQGETLGADDIIMIVIDPFFDRRNGYEFELNANAVREEGIYQNVTGVERDCGGILQGATTIDEPGWIAEIRIPFQTISFDPATDRWGINFRRAIRRNDEGIAWVSRNRQLNPSIAGTATGFSALRQGLGLDVVPYLIMRDERVFGPGGREEQVLEPQLDMFYKITPQLNAALTLNTDFSATEVDNRQVNLTRFSLFFPERRDFFLRDADIFEFGRISQNGRPFFSRRIGLSASGAPVDIEAGAKLSGRIGDWNLGSLFVAQGEDPASGLEAQNVFVGRAALNVLSESLLGVIATHGDPRRGLDNNVLGADFRYRNSRLPGGRVLQGDAWYQQSETEGLDGDEAAWGLGLSSPNNAGWRGGADFMRIEENFYPALGFVNQSGIDDYGGSAGYRHFFAPGGLLRSVYGGAELYRTRTIGGEPVSGRNGLFVDFNNNTGDGLSMGLWESREVLARDFRIHRAPDGSRSIVIAAGDYRFTQGNFGLNFGNQRRVSGRVGLNGGEFYRGNHFERSADLNWRPTRYLRFGLGYREDEIHLPEGNFSVRLATLSSQISFTSTLSWSNLIQYDNVSEEIGLNSRLHWIPEAGRQAFLVLNYGLADRDRDNNFESTRSDLTLKFNYTFRF